MNETSEPQERSAQKTEYIRQFAGREVGAVFKSLDSSDDGLNQERVKRQLKKDGLNVVREERRVQTIFLLFNNFKNPLVITLLIVSGVSFILGNTFNGCIIAFMVLMSVMLNFVQEYRADQAVRKLKECVLTQTLVIRGGKSTKIPTVGLVRGDIVELNAGDVVPADARVISAKDFFINQSTLTGEAFPVEKNEKVLPNVSEHMNVTEFHNLIFAGTAVATGTARAIVVATGMRTQYGAIAAELGKGEELNEFTRGIARFSVFIVRVIIVLVAIVFSFVAFKNGDFLEAFLFAIAIAVGMTPEFLPAIMAIMMARGSISMSKKGVIVRRLSAIPAFGSIDVLCTDKTGTITEDRIALIECLDPEGTQSADVFRFAYITSAFQTGIENPLDEAILEKQTLSMDEYKKIDEIPFDFERKRMSVVVEYKGDVVLVTKGAPEEMFNIASTYQVGDTVAAFDEAARHRATEIYNRQSRQGFRVLAVGMRTIHGGFGTEHVYTKAEESGLTFVGFASFLDPAKVDARKAIDQLEGLGIRIKVITGDNELVTEKICGEADIPVTGVLLGSDVRAFTEDELTEQVKTVSVFARCTPFDKLAIIRALKRSGHVVGYLGDGINDALPLKEADVGISVADAVDVAKESADFILTKKDLTSLVEGVLEGRKSFGNTIKYVMMGLSSNFGNMFSMAGAAFLLPFLPMLPIQILLNNFLYDFAQVAVSTDTVDETFMGKPRRWDISFIKRTMYVFGPLSSVFDFLMFGVLWLFMRGNPSVFQTGWFIGSLATQTLVIHVIRTRFTPFFQSTASIALIATTLSVTVIGWLLPLTPLGAAVGLVPLPPMLYIALAGIVILYLVTAEVAKRWFYRNMIKEV